MEEEFYSVLKLVSGEEVIAKVCPCHEDDETILMLDKPVTVKDIVMTKNGMRAYRVEPWVKVVEDELFFISMDKIITMTEVSDPDTLRMYRRYIRDTSKDSDESTARVKASKTLGYVSNVKDFKNTLEKLYKSS